MKRSQQWTFGLLLAIGCSLVAHPSLASTECIPNENDDLIDHPDGGNDGPRRSRDGDECEDDVRPPPKSGGGPSLVTTLVAGSTRRVLVSTDLSLLAASVDPKERWVARASGISQTAPPQVVEIGVAPNPQGYHLVLRDQSGRMEAFAMPLPQPATEVVVWSVAISRDHAGDFLSIGPPSGEGAVWRLAADANVLVVGDVASEAVPEVIAPGAGEPTLGL